jgi:hypothetical protein
MRHEYFFDGEAFVFYYTQGGTGNAFPISWTKHTHPMPSLGQCPPQVISAPATTAASGREYVGNETHIKF